MENAFISHLIEPVKVRDLEHGGVNRVKLNGDGTPMTVAVELQPLDGRSRDAYQHGTWTRNLFGHDYVEAVHLHAFVAGAVNCARAGSRQERGKQESQ